MLMVTEAGDGVEFDAGRDEGPLAHLDGLDDRQIQGLFARLLRRWGVPDDRAARILRVDRREFRALLRVDVPIELFVGQADGDDRPEPVAVPRQPVRRKPRP